MRTVRDLPGPDGARVYVGGQAAELIDTTHAIGTRLPLAGLLIVLTTFTVLFLFTGSLVQPAAGAHRPGRSQVSSEMDTTISFALPGRVRAPDLTGPGPGGPIVPHSEPARPPADARKLGAQPRLRPARSRRPAPNARGGLLLPHRNRWHGGSAVIKMALHVPPPKEL